MRPLPATIQRQHAHRRGMSLDQKPQLLSPFLGRLSTNDQQPSQGDSQVSIANTGQEQPQHTMQAAQQQSMAQPGHHFQQFADLPPLQTSFPPQPHVQSQPQPSSHPHHPSIQQLKDLEQHIKAVYGAHAQVKVSIVPSPVPSPQHNSPMVPPMDHLDLAPMPSSFSDACEINLEPPPEDQGFSFNFSHQPESDNGYESSFYSSDAISPGCSPSTSPRPRSIASFQHQGHLAPAPPHLSLSRRPSLLPMSRSSTDMDGYLSSSPTKAPLSPRAMSIADLNLDATIEETGISPEEVQAYISEQDPTNHRWTCLFPECGKTFGRRENIRSHVQTHLGDRQYKCNHCGKCFVRQHDLKRHAKIHTGDKPYKCPCGAGFARQDALTRHRQRGMCDGAFPGAVKKSARRGRPRKNRPEMAERLEKANKTRQAQGDSYASSSSSGPSPGSSGYSPVPNINEYDSSQFTNLQSLQTSDAQSSSFRSAMSSPVCMNVLADKELVIPIVHPAHWRLRTPTRMKTTMTSTLPRMPSSNSLRKTSVASLPRLSRLLLSLLTTTFSACRRARRTGRLVRSNAPSLDVPCQQHTAHLLPHLLWARLAWTREMTLTSMMTSTASHPAPSTPATACLPCGTPSTVTRSATNS